MIRPPTRDKAEAAVRTLLRFVGENPNRDGLRDTPGRVIRYLEEATSGYDEDPAVILSKTFSTDDMEDVTRYDNMVVLRDIPWYGICEHHLVTIDGLAHLAYIPKKRVVGISKLARLVDCFSRRLIIQETMTSQIADAMQKYLRTKDVAVVLDATHYCMVSRGVRKTGSRLRTADMRGVFLKTTGAQTELMFHLQQKG